MLIIQENNINNIVFHRRYLQFKYMNNIINVIKVEKIIIYKYSYYR